MEVGYGTLTVTLEREGDNEPAQTVSDDKLIEPPRKKQSSYPFSVFFILSNEFCERFSYYGMRAILVLYLTRWLKFAENEATSVFHAFSMLCYLMPLFGAVIADGFLGRYKTILYMSCVYFLGNLILAATAVPPAEVIGPSIGLVLIACGTGGIKASVAPFGADQFSTGMEKWRNSFFSAFYFMINLGSTISMLVTPVLRADVKCFGEDCYLLAFGLPAILMLISIVLFFAGRSSYTFVPPSGNVIGKTLKCIFYGIKGKLSRSNYEEKRSHWLYYADDKYDPMFIEDVRRLLKVLLMFLPLPLFWGLSNQQGSRWTLQAEHMDGNMGIFGTLKPDQMQALNPILILVLIPLFDRGLYPLMDKCKIPNRPLQRMVVGLFISSAAFICAGLVQIKIDNAEIPKLVKGDAGITFMNTLPCDIQVRAGFYDGKIHTSQMSDFLERPPGSYKIHIESSCTPGQTKTASADMSFLADTAYRLIVYSDNKLTTHIAQFKDKRDKPKHGDASLSIFSTLDLSKLVISSNTVEPTITMGVNFNVTQYKATDFKDITPTKYSVFSMSNVGHKNASLTHLGVEFTVGTGGVYTGFIYGTNKQAHMKLYTDVSENSVSMVWLIPQYVLITIGEVLFSISGLSFAYSQAPSSLKSVVQSVWLLTVSGGDLVVIIVANIHAIPSQMAEFFLFAFLMFFDTIIFMVMTLFYTYKPNSLYSEIADDSTGIDSSDTSPIMEKAGEEFPLQEHSIKQE